MVPDYLVDDKSQEFLRKLGVQLCFSGQFAQPGDLRFFASGIAGRQGVFGFVGADRFGNAEPLGQDVDQRGIDIVDAGAKAGERGVGVEFGHSGWLA